MLTVVVGCLEADFLWWDFEALPDVVSGEYLRPRELYLFLSPTTLDSFLMTLTPEYWLATERGKRPVCSSLRADFSAAACFSAAAFSPAFFFSLAFLVSDFFFSTAIFVSTFSSLAVSKDVALSELVAEGLNKSSGLSSSLEGLSKMAFFFVATTAAARKLWRRLLGVMSDSGLGLLETVRAYEYNDGEAYLPFGHMVIRKGSSSETEKTLGTLTDGRSSLLVSAGEVLAGKLLRRRLSNNLFDKRVSHADK